MLLEKSHVFVAGILHSAIGVMNHPEREFTGNGAKRNVSSLFCAALRVRFCITHAPLQ